MDIVALMLFFESRGYVSQNYVHDSSVPVVSSQGTADVQEGGPSWSQARFTIRRTTSKAEPVGREAERPASVTEDQGSYSLA